MIMIQKSTENIMRKVKKQIIFVLIIMILITFLVACDRTIGNIESSGDVNTLKEKDITKNPTENTSENITESTDQDTKTVIEEPVLINEVVITPPSIDVDSEAQFESKNYAGQNNTKQYEIDIREEGFQNDLWYYNYQLELDSYSTNFEIIINKSKTQSEHMQEIFNKVLYKYQPKGDIGIYIKDLVTGSYFANNSYRTKYYEDTKKDEGFFRAASEIKLFMSITIYELVVSGKIHLDETYYDEVTNEYYQIQECIKKMISESDNSTYNILLRLVGNDALNRVIREIGYESCTFYGELNPAIGYSVENNIIRHNTDIIGGRISLFETGKLMEYIYNNKNTDTNIKFIHDCLLNNIYKQRIPCGINYKYDVANKTGTATDYGVFHDAAIIYCKHPIVLIIFTQNETLTEAEDIIKTISEDIVDFIDELHLAKEVNSFHE